MGNVGSTRGGGGNGRRRNSLPHYHRQLAITVPLPAPFDRHHHRGGGGAHGDYSATHPDWVDGEGYACPPPTPERTVTAGVVHPKDFNIRNDVNLNKETLSLERDEQNPGRYLVAFTFDAAVAGSIVVYFFAKDEFNHNLAATKENLLEPVTVSFQQGMGQKFRQPSGTGIDFSMFEEAELIKEGEMEVYPLAVKAEASPSNNQGPVGESQKIESSNSQITQAVFEKKGNGEYRVHVLRQMLWVNGTRYEMQKIYGIGNSVDGDFDGNDPGKECVICLSEPRDTAVLPCRHMCMCSACAKILRFQTNRCPICRQPAELLVEIKFDRS